MKIFRDQIIGVILLISMSLMPSVVFAKSDLSPLSVSKMAKIKAGFLLHFTSYVTWPNTDNSSVNLCIIGKDPFGTFIDKMLDAKPRNRHGNRIILTRLQVGDDVGICQLIFITQNSAVKEFWKTLPEDHSILLISEYAGFTNIGGIINFYEERKRIKIAINLDEARSHKLYISSELLKIVKIISNK